MNYSTTNLSGISLVALGLGHFLLFPAPHGGAFVTLYAIKTNPHLYPGVGGFEVYFDCTTRHLKKG